MARDSNAKASLEAALETVGALPVAKRGSTDNWLIDEIELGHGIFTIGRLASELSLFGPLLTTVLAQRWGRLNWPQRLLAVQIAERAPSPEFLPMLVESLQPHQYYFLRLCAASALATLDVPVEAELLDKLAQDDEAEVRAKALQIAAQGGKLMEIEQLQRALQDEDAGVRRQAVDALAKLPGDRAMLLLLNTLDDRQRGVALAAQKHLMARAEERDLVLDMIGRLQDFGTRGRYRQPLAVKALARLGDRRAVAPLVDHLTICANKEVKLSIASTLGRLGGEEALPGLWTLARDEDVTVCEAALRAMKRIPSEASAPALLDVLEYLERTDNLLMTGISKPLADALAKVPGKAGDELLLRALISSRYWIARDTAPHCAKRKLPVSAAKLRAHLAAHPRIRTELRKAYAELVPLADLDAEGDDAVEPGTEFSRPPRRQAPSREQIEALSDADLVAYAQSQESIYDIDHAAWERLHKIDSAEASLQLRRFLKSFNMYDRASAARTLAARGQTLSDHDRAAIRMCGPLDQREQLQEFSQVLGDVLQETLIDELFATEAMIQVLWDSGHAYRIPFALRWLGININGRNYNKVALNCLKTEPEQVEPEALKALREPRQYRCDPGQLALLLGRFKSRAAVDDLIAGLRQRDVSRAHQKCFAEALGKIGDARAIPVLVDMLPTVFEGPPLRQVLEALARLGATEAVPAIKSRRIKSPQLQAVRQKALDRLTR